MYPTKNFNMFSVSGEFIGSITAREAADRFDLGVSSIHRIVKRLGRIYNYYLTEHEKFSDLITAINIKNERDYERRSQSITSRFVSIGDDSFQPRTSYYENEEMYASFTYNWNVYYRQFLPDILDEMPNKYRTEDYNYKDLQLPEHKI